MTEFEIVAALFGVALSIVSFFLRKLYSSIEIDAMEMKRMIKEIGKDLESHKLLAARSYLDKSEILIVREEIKYMSNGINERLNGIEEHLRLHYERRST